MTVYLRSLLDDNDNCRGRRLIWGCRSLRESHDLQLAVAMEGHYILLLAWLTQEAEKGFCIWRTKDCFA